jgi:hypothetical protein
MVSFELFVKAMPPSLSELKVLPSFCFAFKIPDDRAVPNIYTKSELPAKHQTIYLAFGQYMLEPFCGQSTCLIIQMASYT